jgi:hypothetical protein
MTAIDSTTTNKPNVVMRGRSEGPGVMGLREMSRGRMVGRVNVECVGDRFGEGLIVERDVDARGLGAGVFGSAGRARASGFFWWPRGVAGECGYYSRLGM